MKVFNKICRCCLQPSKGLIKFKEKLTNDTKISECFENLTGIKINEEIYSKICQDCLQKIRNASDFIQTCQDNDHKFHELLESEGIKSRLEGEFELVTIKNETDDNLISIISYDNYNLETPDSDLKIEKIETDPVEICNEFEIPEIVDSGKAKLNPESRFYIKEHCSYCNATFRGANAITNCQKHERIFHTDVKSFQYTCDLCGKICRQKASILDHMRRHLGLCEIQCTVCDRKFPTSAAMRSHRARVHPKLENIRKTAILKQIKQKEQEKNNMTFNCAFCEPTRKFKKWSTCNLHERKIHNKGSMFICDLCGDFKKNKWLISEHIKSHLGIKDFVCELPLCDRKFVTKRALKKHKENVHNLLPKRFQCPHCDAAFHLKVGLQKHMKIHTDERDYQCNLCGKTFRHHNTFSEHMRVHNNEYNATCQYCGKKFQRSSSFRKHIIRHQNDAAGIVYKCTICSKGMKREETLISHLKIHTGEKEFGCMYCEKRFHQKYQLTRHVLSMHLNSNFHCKLCGFQMRLRKQFQMKYILHVRENHSNEMTQQELEIFENEIKKLKYKDLCDDLPADLRTRRSTYLCKICQLYFSTAQQLATHNQRAHPQSNG